MGFATTLLALAGNRELRQRIRAKYLAHFNTNPYSAGTIAGIVIRSERAGDPEIDRILGALQSSLAASGDEFFWRALRPTLLLLGLIAATFEPLAGPVVFLLPFVAVTQWVRIRGVVLGLNQGKQAALAAVKNHTRAAGWLVMIAAFLVGVLAVRALTVLADYYVVVPVGLASWFVLYRPGNAAYVLVSGLLILLLMKVLL